MNIELKKRFFTSFFLITLLFLMYIYSYVMIISLIIIGVITWVEFYALISKIPRKVTVGQVREIFKEQGWY